MIEVAAGGIVYRQKFERQEILLIQDRYGCWTFPKGKKELGETDEETALREIEEETGIQGEITEEIIQMKYEYMHEEHGKINKNVIYYLVKAVGGTIKPQEEEVNALEWFTLHDAEKKLTDEGYANNQSAFETAKDRLQVLYRNNGLH